MIALSKEKRPSAQTERPEKNRNSRQELETRNLIGASMSSLSNNNNNYKNFLNKNGRLYYVNS